MLLKDFKPGLALKEWIKCYRIVHFKFDSNMLPPPKPYTPRPEQCLAFYPLDTEKVTYSDKKEGINNVRVALIGQHSQVTLREIGSDFLVIQAIFQPGALYRLCNIPSGEFYNQYLDASLIFNTDVHFVNEQLFHCGSYSEMVDVLDIYFLNKVSKIKKPSSSVDPIISILNKNISASLDYLAKQSFYSYKQFERHFAQRTGVTPRYYQRLVRFDHAFRMKNLPGNLSWRNIAWDCNYSDYQHLAKDYKEFTGYTPMEFHSLGTPEEVLGIAETFYETEER